MQTWGLEFRYYKTWFFFPFPFLSKFLHFSFLFCLFPFFLLHIQSGRKRFEWNIRKWFTQKTSSRKRRQDSEHCWSLLKHGLSMQQLGQTKHGVPLSTSRFRPASKQIPLTKKQKDSETKTKERIPMTRFFNYIFFLLLKVWQMEQSVWTLFNSKVLRVESSFEPSKIK